MSKRTDPNPEISDSSVVSGSIDPAEFYDFLMAKGFEDLKCELCGAPDWVLSSAGGPIVDTMAQTVVAQDKHGFVGVTKQPFVFIVCTGCGNTKLMSAAMINARMKPDDPANKELLDELNALKVKSSKAQ